jgi:endoglucanase
MCNIRRPSDHVLGLLLSALAVVVLVSFQSDAISFAAEPDKTPATQPTSQPTSIRIDAGATAQFIDSAGNVWLADKGFEGGETVDRGTDTKIENTKDPAIYRTEHYGMTSFSQPLPNGKYIVKLHFAETSGAISGVGERVFSIKVEDQELKDFDVWAKANGRDRAYIETVNVEITDGKLDITFTPKTQNPEINGIEIIPAP